MDREVKSYVLRRSEDSESPSKLLSGLCAGAQSTAIVRGDGGGWSRLGDCRSGSEKTRTLIYRVAYLIDKGVDPGSILW